MNEAEEFTGEQIESCPTLLTVFEALKVVLVILVIIHLLPLLFFADIPWQYIAARPLCSLPRSGLTIATEEDSWRRRRRQL